MSILSKWCFFNDLDVSHLKMWNIFKSCQPFSQVFSITIRIKFIYFPLVSCLLFQSSFSMIKEDSAKITIANYLKKVGDWNAVHTLQKNYTLSMGNQGEEEWTHYFQFNPFKFRLDILSDEGLKISCITENSEWSQDGGIVRIMPQELLSLSKNSSFPNEFNFPNPLGIMHM